MDKIRVVIFRDGDQWVAQCLEVDIAAQADDLDTVRSRIAVAVNAEADASAKANGEQFKGIEAAPKHFQEMWAKASSFRSSSSIARDPRPLTLETAIAA